MGFQEWCPAPFLKTPLLYGLFRKYYQSIFYLIFALLGLRMETEVRTGRGWIDAVAATAETVYVFEFKLDGTAEEALAQCRRNDYALRYRGGDRKVLLVGVPFDTQTRNIGEWQVEEVDGLII